MYIFWFWGVWYVDISYKPQPASEKLPGHYTWLSPVRRWSLLQESHTFIPRLTWVSESPELHTLLPSSLLNMVPFPAETHVQATPWLPKWGNHIFSLLSKDLPKFVMPSCLGPFKTVLYTSYRCLLKQVLELSYPIGSQLKHRLWRQAFWNLIPSLLITSCVILNTSLYLLGHRIFVYRIVWTWLWTLPSLTLCKPSRETL